MQNKALSYFIVRFFIAMLLISSLVSLSRSQKAPGRDEFGSSLKRWEREEDKKKADEAKKEDNKNRSEESIKLDTSMVSLDILVLDKEGRSVSGLSKDDFSISEDETPQEIAGIFLGDGSIIPRSIVLLIDSSGSQLPFIENSVAAAKALINKLRPEDRMAIVTDDVLLLAEFTNNKQKLNDALDSFRMQVTSGRIGRSEQYSALLATLQELIGGAEFPIIIFQTDGDELEMLRNPAEPPPIARNSARSQRRFKAYSLEDIHTLALTARVTVNTVIPGVKLLGVPFEERVERTRTLFEKQFKTRTGGTWRPQTPAFEYTLQQRAQSLLKQQQALDKIARLTGGRSEFLETPEQATGIYDRIFTSIEHRYLLTYYPTNTKRDGKLRQVEIKVRNHPEYVISGKKSYYAASQ